MVAFIFGCGFFIGGFLGLSIGWAAFMKEIVRGGPVRMQEEIIKRVRTDLDLKGEQRAAVRQIVTETALELDAATKEVRPQVGAILGRAEDRLAAELTDKQRAKLKNFLNAARRRWQPATPSPSGDGAK
jgi:hypothetical protein